MRGRHRRTAIWRTANGRGGLGLRQGPDTKLEVGGGSIRRSIRSGEFELGNPGYGKMCEAVGTRGKPPIMAAFPWRNVGVRIRPKVGQALQRHHWGGPPPFTAFSWPEASEAELEDDWVMTHEFRATGFRPYQAAITGLRTVSLLRWTKWRVSRQGI